MIDDIARYTDLLVELSISPEQFYILWLVDTKDESNIFKYRNKFGQFNVEAIIDLIDRGFIEDFGLIKNDHRSFNIYDFIVTDKFKASVMIDKDEAVEELISIFPSFMVINGVKIAAKSYDIDNLSKLYFPNHRNNKIKHEKIINITKRYYATKNGIADRKLENYITGRYWILYEELLNGGAASPDLITNY